MNKKDPIREALCEILDQANKYQEGSFVDLLRSKKKAEEPKEEPEIVVEKEDDEMMDDDLKAKLLKALME